MLAQTLSATLALTLRSIDQVVMTAQVAAAEAMAVVVVVAATAAAVAAMVVVAAAAAVAMMAMMMVVAMMAMMMVVAVEMVRPPSLMRQDTSSQVKSSQGHPSLRRSRSTFGSGGRALALSFDS